MEQKKEIKNIVIVGSWNSLLFNVKWLNDNVYDGELPEKIQTELVITGNTIQKRVFHLPNYKLEISPERLCFILKEINQENFDSIVDDANKILTKLQHTPLQKMGVNLVYFDKTEKPFLTAFDFYKLDDMVAANEILTLDKKEYTLNLSIKRKSDVVEFNFNYSHKIEDVAHIKSILKIGLYSKFEEESNIIISEIMEKYNA